MHLRGAFCTGLEDVEACFNKSRAGVAEGGSRQCNSHMCGNLYTGPEDLEACADTSRAGDADGGKDKCTVFCVQELKILKHALTDPELCHAAKGNRQLCGVLCTGPEDVEACADGSRAGDAERGSRHCNIHMHGVLCTGPEDLEACAQPDRFRAGDAAGGDHAQRPEL